MVVVFRSAFLPLPCLYFYFLHKGSQRWSRYFLSNSHSRPPPSAPKATLTIVHGTVDHAGVYAELAAALTAVGVAVFASDMRGWGLSDGEALYFHDLGPGPSECNSKLLEVKKKMTWS